MPLLQAMAMKVGAVPLLSWRRRNEPPRILFSKPRDLRNIFAGLRDVGGVTYEKHAHFPVHWFEQ
jgi:hypothetical protein